MRKDCLHSKNIYFQICHKEKYQVMGERVTVLKRQSTSARRLNWISMFFGERDHCYAFLCVTHAIFLHIVDNENQ